MDKQQLPEDGVYTESTDGLDTEGHRFYVDGTDATEDTEGHKVYLRIDEGEDTEGHIKIRIDGDDSEDTEGHRTP
ncbi:MAG TPA: hypothetical protein PKX29_04325, partial [Phycicoccus sp.]|nr:hypothetical protein [Phycicoccus sp.]